MSPDTVAARGPSCAPGEWRRRAMSTVPRRTAAGAAGRAERRPRRRPRPTPRSGVVLGPRAWSSKSSPMRSTTQAGEPPSGIDRFACSIGTSCASIGRSSNPARMATCSRGEQTSGPGPCRRVAVALGVAQRSDDDGDDVADIHDRPARVHRWPVHRAGGHLRRPGQGALHEAVGAHNTGGDARGRDALLGVVVQTGEDQTRVRASPDDGQLDQVCDAGLRGRLGEVGPKRGELRRGFGGYEDRIEPVDGPGQRARGGGGRQAARAPSGSRATDASLRVMARTRAPSARNCLAT